MSFSKIILNAVKKMKAPLLICVCNNYLTYQDFASNSVIHHSGQSLLSETFDQDILLKLKQTFLMIQSLCRTKCMPRMRQ